MFPDRRPRRLRKNPVLREMLSETSWDLSHLIYPLFLVEGRAVRREVASMPGVFQLSLDQLLEEVALIYQLGIPAVMLFGVPDQKDLIASNAYSENALVAQAISAIKQKVPDLLVFADVCLCEYTDHGHCGVIQKHPQGFEIDNDATLLVLSRIAETYARAGADVIAPSDMMDGRVGAIRKTLDQAGYPELPILSYAVKYASAFYGPFRDAAQSAPQFGDRRSYQMDFRNTREAFIEAEADILEGADFLMVKPALTSLDILGSLKQHFRVPLVAYQVSGEYAMLKAAAAQGSLDLQKIVFETLTVIRRAGAQLIVTYFAKEIAEKWKSNF